MDEGCTAGCDAISRRAGAGTRSARQATLSDRSAKASVVHARLVALPARPLGSRGGGRHAARFLAVDVQFLLLARAEAPTRECAIMPGA